MNISGDLQELEQTRSNAQVSFQQGEEKNRSSSLLMGLGFGSVISSTFFSILRPISSGFESINNLLLGAQNLINNFLLGSDGLFTPLIQNASKFGEGGIFDLIFYILALDKILPFAVTEIIPFFLILVDILINWFLIFMTALGVILAFNAFRRLLSCLPWFKVI